jgi:hypothetical protein
LGNVALDVMISFLVVHMVQPPGGFVIVAQHWPASLISVLALGLPLRMGHFPKKLHRYFSAPITKGVPDWKSTRDFVSSYQDRSVVYLLSRDTAFL